MNGVVMAMVPMLLLARPLYIEWAPPWYTDKEVTPQMIKLPWLLEHEKTIHRSKEELESLIRYLHKRQPETDIEKIRETVIEGEKEGEKADELHLKMYYDSKLNSKDPKDIEIPVIIGYLDTECYYWAEDVILYLGKRSVPALIDALKSKNGSKKVRQKSALILGKLGTMFVGEIDDAVPTLVNAANDKEEEVIVRYAAASALGSIEPSAARNLVPLLIEALEYKNRAAQTPAAYTLGLIGQIPENAVSALGDMLKEPNPFYDNFELRSKRTAAFALGKVKPTTPGVRAMLFEALEYEDACIRALAANSLYNIDGTSILESIIDLLLLFSKEEDPVARATVAWCLGEIGPPARKALPVLIETRDDDKEAIVRAEAHKAIEKIRALADKPPVAPGVAADRISTEIGTQSRNVCEIKKLSRENAALRKLLVDLEKRMSEKKKISKKKEYELSPQLLAQLVQDGIKAGKTNEEIVLLVLDRSPDLGRESVEIMVKEIREMYDLAKDTDKDYGAELNQIIIDELNAGKTDEEILKAAMLVFDLFNRYPDVYRETVERRIKELRQALDIEKKQKKSKEK